MKTPCIKVCKVENGKCIGCGRTLEHIRLWSSYTDEQRQFIMDNINLAKERK